MHSILSVVKLTFDSCNISQIKSFSHIHILNKNEIIQKLHLII